MNQTIEKKSIEFNLLDHGSLKDSPKSGFTATRRTNDDTTHTLIERFLQLNHLLDLTSIFHQEERLFLHHLIKKKQRNVRNIEIEMEIKIENCKKTDEFRQEIFEK